ncbi:hypothetical protein COT72_00945 [archaeon CG10_big_fil_rev_8_21_14_0_10_43_11]|nr:MAG: hypothetical protein COT72_00945 [archaeon CG10_big_fil_rev_8_21_14_0_10_43_11]
MMRQRPIGRGLRIERIVIVLFFTIGLVGISIFIFFGSAGSPSVVCHAETADAVLANPRNSDTEKISYLLDAADQCVTEFSANATAQNTHFYLMTQSLHLLENYEEENMTQLIYDFSVFSKQIAQNQYETLRAFDAHTQRLLSQTLAVNDVINERIFASMQALADATSREFGSLEAEIVSYQQSIGLIGVKAQVSMEFLRVLERMELSQNAQTILSRAQSAHNVSRYDNAFAFELQTLRSI